MSFKAEKALPVLDYDFHPHVDASGIVPEPSQKAIKRFRKASFDIFQGRTPEDLGKLDPDEQEEIAEAMKPLLADLCQGQPSAKELDEMPYRLLNAFSGWLMGQLANPT